MDNTKFYQCWKYIEKKAFSPNSKKEDIEYWLRSYLKFFYNTFKNENYFSKPFDNKRNKFIEELIFKPIETIFRFSLNSDGKGFSFSLTWEKNKSTPPNFTFEYDPQYKCEWDYLSHESKINRKNSGFNESELKDILKNMIDHPAVHCHMYNESWSKTLRDYFIYSSETIEPRFNHWDETKQIDYIRNTLHEIRLGMPATNPFLFLYQVSFQFLSIFGEEKKQNELMRLTEVIWENKNKMSISPGTLFSLK